LLNQSDFPTSDPIRWVQTNRDLLLHVSASQDP